MSFLMAVLLDTGPIGKKIWVQEGLVLLLDGSREESLSKKATFEQLSLRFSYGLFFSNEVTRQEGLYR